MMVYPLCSDNRQFLEFIVKKYSVLGTVTSKIIFSFTFADQTCLPKARTSYIMFKYRP